MTFNPGELVPMATLPNFRDIGGWPTHGGGRVRRGLLYRSVALHGRGSRATPRTALESRSGRSDA